MKKILLGIGVFGIGLLTVFWITSPDPIEPTENPTVVTGDPMDATAEFFSLWHQAALSTTTDPVAEDLLSHPRLTEPVRTYLASALTAEDQLLDPVLCQVETPPRIGTKISFQLDSEAEVHVLSRGLPERSANFTVVKLAGRDGEWAISDIRCSTGETGPEREFSFDREGFLLKSVPPPLNSDYWHLVFEENGVNGHTAPLFFNASSTCVSRDGSESTCDPNTFTDATKALVQGHMTEAGVDVARITILP